MQWQRRLALAAAMLSLLAPGAAAPADDTEAAPGGWPQYRGVRRDGISSNTSRPGHWAESGPSVVWRRPLGSAFSQLTVVGDAVFTGTSDEEREYLVRLDARTGQEVWRAPVGPVFVHESGNGPRSTPTSDGSRVYLLGARGNLVAVRPEDGSAVWSFDLAERFGAEVPRFGFSGSPLVVDGLLVLEVGGAEDSWLAALDRETGETRWTTLSGPVGYTSPLFAVLDGVPQILTERGKTITSLSSEGKVLWTHELEEAAIAMPLVVGSDRVFVSASGDTGCVMLRVRKSEAGFRVEELWKNRNMRNHFNSSLVVGDYIYGFDNATLKCLSAETGETMWAKRGFGKGSLAAEGSRLYVLGDQGRVALVEATAEGYLEAGALQAIEGKSWTAPAVFGGRVYLRNLAEVTCLDFGG